MSKRSRLSTPIIRNIILFVTTFFLTIIILTTIFSFLIFYEPAPRYEVRAKKQRTAPDYTVEEITQFHSLYHMAVTESFFHLNLIPWYARTYDLVKIAVSQPDIPSSIWQNIPKEHQTYEISLLAVKNNTPVYLAYSSSSSYGYGSYEDSILKEIPPQHRTEELVLMAVKNHGMALQYAPQEIITSAIAQTAVESNPHALRYVPSTFLTESLIRTALSLDGTTFAYLPKELITYDLATLAINSSPSAIQYVPETFIDGILAMLAVRKNGLMLQYLPKDSLTAEIISIAMHQNAGAIKYLDKKIINKDFALLAVMRDGDLLKYIPTELMTSKILLQAVQQQGEAIRHIPNQLLTKDIALTAITATSNAIQWIPEPYLTEEIIRQGILSTPYLLYDDKRFKKYLNTQELALFAVQHNPSFLLQVPMNLRVDAVAEVAFQKNIHIFPYLPEHERTLERSIIAVSNNLAQTITHVPKHHKTREFFEEILPLNGLVIEFMPDKWLNESLIQTAIRQNPWAFTKLPKRYQTASTAQVALELGLPISQVPKKLLNTTLVRDLLFEDPRRIKHTPTEYITQEIADFVLAYHIDYVEFIPQEFINYETAQLAIESNPLNFEHIPDQLKTYSLSYQAIEQNPMMIIYLPLHFAEEQTTQEIPHETR
ncbi:DUF4116 domain-containing protein [Entomospira entomophila]|uniref:DUF4116 domain-containing protein n=1 Tax=Entomospira entomophila TaxID=2719988 RepID=A0A968KQU8_9SPIO|nr:DUF4116 domain-containing protein [Entomospira entomophilus]NIZ40154.1 DUF4116 domain-containing protein [Entomospira entomophilus]WDI35712.1 DUF4116 domain-containing protein [Entomospira entomophilus]